MDRIEFIGAQGAGKSTVFRHLLRQRAPRDRWLTPGEARIRVAQRLRRRDLASPWRRGVCLALRWNLLPLKREAVAGWLLRSSAPAVFDALPPWARALMDLQLAQLAGGERPASAAGSLHEPEVPWIATRDGLLKAKAISYSLEALLGMATLEFFRLDAPVVYDDGGLLANQLGLSAAALEALRRMRDGNLPPALPERIFREVRVLMGGLLEHHADLASSARDLAFQVLSAG